MPADDLELVRHLADAADAVTRARFRATDLRVTAKPDRSPVTDADTTAEDALRVLLAAERPNDAVLGEEGGGAATHTGRGWVLDPIDGTKNFSRGNPVWATLIALTVDGTPTVGMVSAPALGRRWWAGTGSGAWCAEQGGPPRRLRVSGVTDLADAVVSTTDQRGFGAARRHWLALVDATWENRAFGDFWQHCLVAEGVLDVAVDPAANPWDLAALSPLLAEAGGRLTDLRGNPTHTGGDGITSNGALHGPALRLLTG